MNRPFLRKVAEVLSDIIGEEETYRWYQEQGPHFLERPHLEREFGSDFPLMGRERDYEKIDTTQPHGKLRSLIRAVIEGGRDR
jgi:hypothetical protein